MRAPLSQSTGHRRVHLAAFVEGVNHTTVWSHPEAGSQIAFDSFEYLARSAERGLFDLVLLGQGLRLREHRSELFEHDIAGRPDTFTLFAALAGVTSHIGLGATINTTFTEPRDLARDFASLEHLTGGRTAWNIVTSNDAFTGRNFRRGGYLDYADRYARALDVVETAQAYWNSWHEDDRSSYAYSGHHVTETGLAALPGSPQHRPVYIQAGDSPAGRDFGARLAEVIFSMHSGTEAAAAFATDFTGRLRAAGRRREDVRILPIARVVLGDNETDARARAREIGFGQVTPQRAIVFAEQVWGRPLDDLDPDGPLPEFDPIPPREHLMQGRVQSKADPVATARRWRERARAEGHSLRSLMVEIYARPTFVGTASSVAEAMGAQVSSGDVDGYALSTHLMPAGFDEISDLLVPELQERGLYPTGYSGTTVREHLGLPVPGSCPHTP